MGLGSVSDPRWYRNTADYTFTQQQVKRADQRLSDLNQLKARSAHLARQCDELAKANERLALQLAATNTSLAAARMMIAVYRNRLEQANRQLQNHADIFSFNVPLVPEPELTIPEQTDE